MELFTILKNLYIRLLFVRPLMKYYLTSQQNLLLTLLIRFNNQLYKSWYSAYALPKYFVNKIICESLYLGFV